MKDKLECKISGEMRWNFVISPLEQAVNLLNLFQFNLKTLNFLYNMRVELL